MISGAKYSCVPTNDIDFTFVGSAMSSGMDPFTNSPKSDLALRFFLVDWRMRGKNVDAWGSSSMNPTGRPLPPPEEEEELTRVGFTEHRRERSKSESMMCPSSLTRTFSGFKSRYTIPSMCKYSNANSTSEANNL